MGEASNAGRKYGVNPIALILQTVAEIGWGTSSLFQKTNNVGNITAYGNTNEYWRGGSVASKSSGLKFRTYSSTQAGWYDMARLIATKYPQAAKVSHDIPAFAKAMAYSPYIDEKNGDNREQYRKNILANYTTLVALLGGSLPSWASGGSATSSKKTKTEAEQLKSATGWLIAGTLVAVAAGVVISSRQRPQVQFRPRPYAYY